MKPFSIGKRIFGGTEYGMKGETTMIHCPFVTADIKELVLSIVGLP